MLDVIEISSSDEDDIVPPRRRSSSLSAIPCPASRLHSIRSSAGDTQGVESDVDRSHHRPARPELERARVRRIVYSSSDSDSEGLLPKIATARQGDVDGNDDVIEITDSSEEGEGEDDDPGGCKRPPPARIGVALVSLPPMLEREYPRNPFDDDDGLLVLSEPKNARKPRRRPQILRTASPDPPAVADRDTHALVKAFSTLSSLTALTDSDADKTHLLSGADHPVPPSPSAIRNSRIPDNALLEATPPTRAKAKSTTPAAKTPRTSKKALALAQQAERAAYAQSLFDELNRTVFAAGLPVGTALIWSNRLLTTAGRARWHRSKEDVHTTSIELATKILDSKERIRNTLSHEMCHLACWVINQDPKEGHGKAWKSWAAKVMRKRPDIDISTRHNYEISYPYEWECESCAKTYGRFSKSIRPDEVVCGACKIGTLHPLFTVRPRKSPSKRTTANGRQAATSPRDSPRLAAPAPPGPVNVFTGMRMPGSFDCGDDGAELDALIVALGELGVKEAGDDD